jgi:hypothetical protein
MNESTISVYLCYLQKLGESQNSLVEWERLQKIDFTLYGPIYVNSRKCKVIYSDRKQMSCFLGTSGGWGKDAHGGGRSKKLKTTEGNS